MSFESDMQKAYQASIAAAEKTIRAVALQTFSNIIQASPVDTGRFRANWQATINAPASNTLNTTQSTVANISVTKATQQYKIDKVLFLTNNLDYAERLEYGYSQQAPSGWVRTNVINAQKALDKFAKQNRP